MKGIVLALQCALHHGNLAYLRNDLGVCLEISSWEYCLALGISFLEYVHFTSSSDFSLDSLNFQPADGKLDSERTNRSCSRTSLLLSHCGASSSQRGSTSVDSRMVQIASFQTSKLASTKMAERALRSFPSKSWILGKRSTAGLR